MLYHQGNNRDNFWKQRNITVAVFVGVCALSLLSSPVRGMFTEGVYVVAGGAWGAGDAFVNTLSSFATNFRDKERLVSENEALVSEIDRMQVQVLDRNLLAERVTKLEEALGRVRSDSRVVADVIVGQRQSLYDTLVVDAGEDEGIAVGNEVVYAGSGIVGEIIETTSSFSKVKLFSSPGVERAVLVGNHFVPANAIGRGMGNFEAKVPQDSAIVVGDTIVSAKGDLLFGVVSLIEEKPAEPFKRIFFRTPFNTTEIRSVEIIIDRSL